MPGASVSKPLRAHRMLKHASPSTAAWQRFAAASGGGWRASWDAATNVPNRIWGPGLAAPGAMASPAIAEQVARRMLAEHIALLAPGASPSDFVLVSNHSDGDIRSIGFVQQAAGRRVVGGQVSFRFKRDRLFLIGSEALPDVRVVQPRARLARVALHTRASEVVRRELDLPLAPVSAPTDEVILPLVADDAVLGYRIASAVTIDGGADGRYLAYVDPDTGAVLAVHQQNLYATGTLLYRSVDRYPGRGRVDRPARRAHVTLGAAAQTTATDGTLTWSPDVGQSVTTGVTGAHATIVNKGEGMALASKTLSLAVGGQAVWDASAQPEEDSQVVTYIAVNAVKDYIRTKIDPAMPKLDEAITANVNIGQNCNAFYDGKAINFFHASTMCQNTGLLEDVVYHEFGHALHAAEIIEGVGTFDGAMSEGAADFLAASLTGDPGMGRGFFYNDKALRELDPMNSEFVWPKDIGEVHHTGLIFGGTFWDLRKALIASLGEAQGIALVNRLFLGALKRSVSIPSSMFEALAADDDDGDLSNGTPHECFIRDAYGRHGLRTASGAAFAPGALDANAKATTVRIDLNGLSSRCQGDELEEVVLAWKPDKGGDTPMAGEVEMTAVGETRYWATLPLAQQDSVLYQARVVFKDGSVLTLPDNLGDPFYQLYQGTTVPLYCTDFEANPLENGWTTHTLDDTPSPWEWGPAGGGGTDPPAAYSGGNFFGLHIGGDYAPKSYSIAELPPIDVGQWSDVRLQYRRWLSVEDNHFDQAQVTINGRKAWANFSSEMGDSSSIHHIDREWRFHDVKLSSIFPGHVFTVGFDLASDEGLHLGGWAIDDLCIVANVHSICGDGVKTATEQCDDGSENADTPNTCRTYCMRPACGDSIRDRGEACDDGPLGSTKCTPQCNEPEAPSVDCCSAGGGPGGPVALSILVGVSLARRRRRRG